MLAARPAAALRAAPRASLRPVATSVARRGMVTAAERWNEEDWHKAHALVKAEQIDLQQWLPDIEGKWKYMTKPQQIGTWVMLEDVMKKDWNELTPNEKRAAWFISYGPYGPRKETPPDFHFKVFWGTVAGIVAAIGFTTTIQNLGGVYKLHPVIMMILTSIFVAVLRCQASSCYLEPGLAGGYEREGTRTKERPYHWCRRRGLQGQRFRCAVSHLKPLHVLCVSLPSALWLEAVLLSVSLFVLANRRKPFLSAACPFPIVHTVALPCPKLGSFDHCITSQSQLLRTHIIRR